MLVCMEKWLVSWIPCPYSKSELCLQDLWSDVASRHVQHVPSAHGQQGVQALLATPLRKARPSFLVQWLKPVYEVWGSCFSHLIKPKNIQTLRSASVSATLMDRLKMRMNGALSHSPVELGGMVQPGKCKPQVNRQNQAKGAWSSLGLGQTHLSRQIFSVSNVSFLKPVWTVQ